MQRWIHNNTIGTFLAFSVCISIAFTLPAQLVKTNVLVIGGGTGGVAAGLQSARMGVQTLIVEPTPWLGGMLTAAGVSATDGNHRMPAGIWGEFRERIRQHYGGAAAVETGWVSNTLFEPHVGARIFREMADKEKALSVWYESELVALRRLSKGWRATIAYNGKKVEVQADILIDGTDLGDVAAMAGAAYDLGMEDRKVTGEAMAPEKSNDIIQDLTVVAILKDYGPGSDRTIPQPPGYDPARFQCSCRETCPDDTTMVNCNMMLSYARLPGNKFMLNWPNKGNDYYANVVEQNAGARKAAFDSARVHTLRYVYFIQNELGRRNLGLADDEFPTMDKLAFYPYHREGRRIRGKVRVNVGHLMDPYAGTMYRSAAIVGDYPIDHHHKENLEAPEIDFPKVPSFNIPLGALIPGQVDRLLVADKAISVSNIVNGSSRLQPVVLQIGQAAGAMAALSVQKKVRPDQLSVREVQRALLASGAYLMPFFDVEPQDQHFQAIQKIGATGILQGRGEPYLWANRTWFDPDSVLLREELVRGIQNWPTSLTLTGNGQQVTIEVLMRLADDITGSAPGTLVEQALCRWAALGLKNFEKERPVTRREAAVLLDAFADPFRGQDVSWSGNWIK
jgi:hypothetical protein